MSTDHLPAKKLMRPGVKALIVHNKKILMIHEHVHRKNGDEFDIVDFPGGGIEFGENLEVALKREVFEEVGLEISVGKTIGAWSFVIADRVHIVCIGYQCSVIGEPQIDTTKNPAEEDIYDVGWYTREEILENKDTMLRNPDMEAAIRNLNI